MLVDQRELKEGDWDTLSGCPLDLNLPCPHSASFLEQGELL